MTREDFINFLYDNGVDYKHFAKVMRLFLYESGFKKYHIMIRVYEEPVLHYMLDIAVDFGKEVDRFVAVFYEEAFYIELYLVSLNRDLTFKKKKVFKAFKRFTKRYFTQLFPEKKEAVLKVITRKGRIKPVYRFGLSHFKRAPYLYEPADERIRHLVPFR